MATQTTDVIELSEGDVDVVAIDGRPYLDAGELFTGTPTAVEQDTSDLTNASVAVSTGALVIKGQTVAIGQAVQWTISGQQAGTDYVVRVTVDTDAGRTKVFDQRFETAAD